MPEETANLRQSRNAIRSPIHPRLAPLKSRGAGGLLFEVSLVSGFCLKKEPRMKRESLPLANRIFLASGLKFAYRKFFHALTGKMLASGFVYHTHPLLCTPHLPTHPLILITAPLGRSRLRRAGVARVPDGLCPT